MGEDALPGHRAENSAGRSGNGTAHRAHAHGARRASARPRAREDRANLRARRHSGLSRRRVPGRPVRLASRRQPPRGLGGSERRPVPRDVPDAEQVLPARRPHHRLPRPRLAGSLGREPLIHIRGRIALGVALCLALSACQGVLVHEVKSDYSHIKVIDYGTRRALYFVGDKELDLVETLIDLREPYRLQHPYAQAMTAGLIYRPEPNSVLLV